MYVMSASYAYVNLNVYMIIVIMISRFQQCPK